MSTDTVVLNGYEHWTTSNGIRTFVGPVRHRATRRISKARAAIAAKLNRSKENAVQPIANDDATTVIPAVQETDDPNATTQNLGLLGQQVNRMLEGLHLPTFHVNPPRPAGYKGTQRGPGWWARTKEAIADSLYDNAFHAMVQNTCKTVGYIALTLTACVVFGKALLWVVAL